MTAIGTPRVCIALSSVLDGDDVPKATPRAVGNDHAALRLVADQQQRGELSTGEDLPAVLLDVRVTHAEEREPRSAKDVLRLEPGDTRCLQLFDVAGGGFRLEK